jgi:hypothetical protein
MKINHLIEFVTGPFETDGGQLVCVQSHKYSTVKLCFKAGNWNIPFAQIKLFTRDRYVDAKATHPDAVNLGDEIVRRWNLHQETPPQPSSPIDLLEVALRVLNEAHSSDPAAMHSMVNQRVPCNELLADHPTIQVGTNRLGDTDKFDVGMVGIINGILEAATGKRLAVAISDDGEGCVVGFVPYTPNASVEALEK